MVFHLFLVQDLLLLGAAASADDAFAAAPALLLLLLHTFAAAGLAGSAYPEAYPRTISLDKHPVFLC